MEMEDNNTRRDFYVDLESGPNNNNSPPSPGSNGVRSLFNKVCSVLAKGEEEGQKLLCGGNGGGGGSNSESDGNCNETTTTGSSGSDHSDENKQQRRKSSSPHKKSPKPPRPPRGPSLDAADLKLIKEISELAMLKRARIERIKAMKKAKVAKQSSSTSVSSAGNLFAMVFTVLFFLVILCQGMSSRITSIDLQTAPEPARMMDNDLITVQYFGVPSVNGPIGLSSGSHISGVDPPDSARRLG